MYSWEIGKGRKQNSRKKRCSFQHVLNVLLTSSLPLQRHPKTMNAKKGRDWRGTKEGCLAKGEEKWHAICGIDNYQYVWWQLYSDCNPLFAYTQTFISSVQSVVSSSLQSYGPQHARPPWPSPTPSLPKLMPIESVMPSNHLILCHPLLLLPSIFPSITVFSNESALRILQWPKYWSFSFSISPSNEHSGLTPLGWTGWISLQSKGLSRVFSTPQFKTIKSSALSFLYSPTFTSILDYWKNHSLD